MLVDSKKVDHRTTIRSVIRHHHWDVMGALCCVVVFQSSREREIQQQVLAQDEEFLELRETFTSLQQEVEAKTKKLKKVTHTNTHTFTRPHPPQSQGVISTPHTLAHDPLTSEP